MYVYIYICIDTFTYTVYLTMCINTYYIMYMYTCIHMHMYICVCNVNIFMNTHIIRCIHADHFSIYINNQITVVYRLKPMRCYASLYLNK